MKIKAAIVGATGIAGQQVLAALDRHPTFEIAALAASERSAGRNFEAAITDADSGMRRWYVAGTEPPEDALRLPVQDARTLRLDGIKTVFAAVESEAARELEPIYAQHVPTISTARPYRMEPDVPLVIPGVNLDHMAWFTPTMALEISRRIGLRLTAYHLVKPIGGISGAIKKLAWRFGISPIEYSFPDYLFEFSLPQE